MLHSLKKRLYFLVAGYFAFWASFVLKRWKPRIIVITGSSGKTTLLHMVEAQLGDKAVYSHNANSSFGIPFHILGMAPNVGSRPAWAGRILAAPFKVFRALPDKKLYVVEADCDRPHEGDFLSSLLHPEAVLWVSVFNTHAKNFDKLAATGKFMSHEEAIAYEFGHFAARATGLVAGNGDQPALVKQLERVRPGVTIRKVSSQNLTNYSVQSTSTLFTIGQQKIRVPGLHPKDVAINLQLVDELLTYLGERVDPSYAALTMPPGRCSVFAGRKQVTLIDSSYNTGLGATKAILNLFALYPNEHKWLVLGDILELGSLEASEHERLAEIVSRLSVERIVLLGPRTRKSTYPLLQRLMPDTPVQSFQYPKEVLEYLQQNLKGGEAVVFKGGRFLEGVIEQLLEHPEDADKLAKRGPAWVKIRQKWGLPR